MIDITLDDRELRQALERLQRRLSDLTPVMREIGELLTERAKQRFETSTGPDGKTWAPNAPATVAAYLGQYKGSYKKNGGLSKKGAARAEGKKPLIGETRSLMGTIHYQPGRDSVTVGSPMQYAAVQQFGARKGAFGKTKRGAPIPWGDIPPRPFLPVTEDGQWLGEDDRNAVLDILREALESAAKPHG